MYTKRMTFLLSFCFSLVINIFAHDYHVSFNGKELIKKFEKCSLVAYKDANGFSIGWGHHRKDIHANMRISQKQADKYFDEDIKMVEKSVNNLLSNLPYKYQFSQGFIDGFSSLVYNCGEGSIKGTAFYNALKRCRVKNGKMNQADLHYVISFVKNTKVKAKGHKQRRMEEMRIMLN